ncbi:MAG: DUF3187 family protein [Treponema sp.]|nr:DUF3187 family protein [Treponema sp.]MCL2271821.1 DUF3187 family protein [Treponema sp.]
MLKYKPLIAVFLLVIATAAHADKPLQTFSKGPLFGKNLYIPFLIHYNFPSLPAKSGEINDLQYHLSVYYGQDARFRVDIVGDYEGRRYDREYVFMDYESCAAEIGVAYNVLNEVQAGVNMRLFSFYGGFLDPFIESFHHFFNFSGGARERFLQNQIYINVPNSNGIPLYLDKSTVSFGDIDLWCKWTFLENTNISLAALGAFKLPTGNLKSLSGSGYPDIAAGLLLDYRIIRLLSLYAQAGIVVPFNGKSYPMFNGLLGAEIHPWKLFSFVLQMNIKTSPLSGSEVPFGWNEDWKVNFNQLPLPQTNVLAGIVVQMNRLRLQLYLEEDAIFNQGNDFAVGISASYTFNIVNFIKSYL